MTAPVRLCGSRLAALQLLHFILIPLPPPPPPSRPKPYHPWCVRAFRSHEANILGGGCLSTQCQILAPYTSVLSLEATGASGQGNPLRLLRCTSMHPGLAH